MVTSVVSGGVVISDGSVDELLLDLPDGVTPPSVGTSIVATGVSSMYTDGVGARQRLLRVSSALGDWQVQ